MSERSPCRCEECVNRYSEAQKALIASNMLITMRIKGNFDDCPACKFMFDSEEADCSKLQLCDRCDHLYNTDYGKCKCWKEDSLLYYEHLIETYSSGYCAYCKSDDIYYEKGLDNSVKFRFEDNIMYCVMTCHECSKRSKEYYNVEYKKTRGI